LALDITIKTNRTHIGSENSKKGFSAMCSRLGVGSRDCGQLPHYRYWDTGLLIVFGWGPLLISYSGENVKK